MIDGRTTNNRTSAVTSATLNPMAAPEFFLSLLSLMTTWAQEKSNQATKAETQTLQQFLEWMRRHDFQLLCDKIESSSETTRALTGMIERDLKSTNEYLGLIAESVTAMANHIEPLHALSASMGAENEQLSEDAVKLLIIFESANYDKMLWMRRIKMIHFFPEGISYPAPSRFMESDIESLESAGFIIVCGHNSSGDPMYNLTRLGAKFAQAAAAKYETTLLSQDPGGF